jgi:endonuclease/exonuclease/phosphatase family metal-dependent hydrolase
MAQEGEVKQPLQYRMMFYNVENLFDTFHDTLKDDYEFVRGGSYGWTWKKFTKKIQNISKVIVEAGGWRPPEIIGLSEVENRLVLIQLIKKTPLERFNYRIIHEESPDQRGIDVALLYQHDQFREICHESITIPLGDTAAKTRDILYVKGILPSNDTVHLFVNHWPSRTGGIPLTQHRRKAAALKLRHVVDSIRSYEPDALMIMMGDFNDEPRDESLVEHLGVKNETANEGYFLYNMMHSFMGKWDVGTNKFRGQWGVIDQFIVSSPLLKQGTNSIIVKEAEIFSPSFLLVKDEAYTGTIPYRTFSGYRYVGGFSDHLPVLLRLEYIK